jgi:hypothetical protein
MEHSCGISRRPHCPSGARRHASQRLRIIPGSRSGKTGGDSSPRRVRLIPRHGVDRPRRPDRRQEGGGPSSVLYRHLSPSRLAGVVAQVDGAARLLRDVSPFLHDRLDDVVVVLRDPVARNEGSMISTSIWFSLIVLITASTTGSAMVVSPFFVVAKMISIVRPLSMNTKASESEK